MKKKTVILDKKNLNLFYKKIRVLKLYKFLGKTICISYCGKEYLGKEKECPEELTVILNILKILNSSNKRERLSLIYDVTCNYLDNEFRTKNLCGFKNDMCECNRNKSKDKQVCSCCTHTKTRIVCEKFDKKRKTCKIKRIGCKLFVCPYLYFEKKVRFPLRKIPYIHYFLSWRQKAIVKTSIFQDKEEVMDKLVKFYKMP